MRHQFEEVGIPWSDGFEAGLYNGFFEAEGGDIVELSVITERGRESRERHLEPGHWLRNLLASAIKARPGYAELIAETAPADDERPYTPIRISARIG